MPRWREVLFGGPSRLGFWTLPVFLLVGLAGAVIAGSLTVVYYSQQVDGLRQETASVRQEAEDTVAQIESVGDEALEAIENQVAAVEESLSRQLPLGDVSEELGVVVIRATQNVAPPRPAPDPTPTAPEVGATTAPDADGGGGSGEQVDPAPVPGPVDPQQETPTQEPTSSPSPTSPPSPSPSPSPTPEPLVEQLGIGFAVAVSDGSTFFATSFGLVADPGSRAGVVEAVEVVTADGAVAATVHDWDERRDLAIVRAPFTGPEVASWRPRSEAVAVGERLWLAGVTTTNVEAQLELTTGYVTDTEILTDLPPLEQFRGAPIVDSLGRVVAIHTTGYQPFGEAAGQDQAVLPVHVLCERLLSGCDALEVPASEVPSDDG